MRLLGASSSLVNWVSLIRLCSNILEAVYIGSDGIAGGLSFRKFAF